MKISQFGNFYPPQKKFAKVMFSQVSVCPQEGHTPSPREDTPPSPLADSPTLGRQPHPGQTPPLVDTPLPSCPVHVRIHPPCPVHAGIHPPAKYMLGYGQQAGVGIPLECILEVTRFSSTHATVWLTNHESRALFPKKF